MPKIIPFASENTFPVKFTQDEFDCIFEIAQKTKQSTYAVMEKCFILGLHVAILDCRHETEPTPVLEDYR